MKKKLWKMSVIYQLVHAYFLYRQFMSENVSACLSQGMKNMKIETFISNSSEHSCSIMSFIKLNRNRCFWLLHSLETNRIKLGFDYSVRNSYSPIMFSWGKKKYAVLWKDNFLHKELMMYLAVYRRH